MIIDFGVMSHKSENLSVYYDAVTKVPGAFSIDALRQLAQLQTKFKSIIHRDNSGNLHISDPDAKLEIDQVEAAVLLECLRMCGWRADAAIRVLLAYDEVSQQLTPIPNGQG